MEYTIHGGSEVSFTNDEIEDTWNWLDAEATNEAHKARDIIDFLRTKNQWIKIRNDDGTLNLPPKGKKVILLQDGRNMAFSKLEYKNDYEILHYLNLYYITHYMETEVPNENNKQKEVKIPKEWGGRGILDTPEIT